MRGKFIISAIFTLLLLALLVASLYVVRQNQDIRQRAGLAGEFILLTQPELRSGEKIQYAVVTNKLASDKFEYRLGHSVTFTGSNKPEDILKSNKISENKTSKFYFSAPGCGYTAKVQVQLLYHEKNTPNPWNAVLSNTDGDTKSIVVPCEANASPDPSIKPTPAPSTTAAPSVSASAVILTPTPAASPTSESSGSAVLGATTAVDSDAIDLATLDNLSIIDAESAAFAGRATPSAQQLTLSFPIKDSRDDVTEDGSYFSATDQLVWLGTGQTVAKSFAGLRFQNVTIPEKSIIQDAWIELYGTENSQTKMDFVLYGDLTDNSNAFSTSSRPSLRTFTSSTTPLSINSSSTPGSKQKFGPLTPIISEIINRSTWRSGNAISIIAKGTGAKWGRKMFASYDINSQAAPRLVVVIQTPAIASAPTPVPSTPEVIVITVSPQPTPTIVPLSSASPSNTTRISSPSPTIRPTPSATLRPTPSASSSAQLPGATPAPSASSGGGFGALLTTPSPSSTNTTLSATPNPTNTALAQNTVVATPLPQNPDTIDQNTTTTSLTANPSGKVSPLPINGTTALTQETDASESNPVAVDTSSTPQVSLSISDNSNWWVYLLLGAGALIIGGIGVVLLL